MSIESVLATRQKGLNPGNPGFGPCLSYDPVEWVKGFLTMDMADAIHNLFRQN